MGPKSQFCRSGIARRARRPSNQRVWALEDGVGSLFVLDPARVFTLGRSESKCSLAVAAAASSVSAIHASIAATDTGRWELTDLSSNGTLLGTTLLLGTTRDIRDGETFHLCSSSRGVSFTLRCLPTQLSECQDWLWHSNAAAAQEQAAAAVAEQHRLRLSAAAADAAARQVAAAAAPHWHQLMRTSENSVLAKREVQPQEGTVRHLQEAVCECLRAHTHTRARAHTHTQRNTTQVARESAQRSARGAGVEPGRVGSR